MSTATVTEQGSGQALSVAAVRAWVDVLAAGPPAGLGDAARVELLGVLESLKGAAAAAQARVSVDFADSQITQRLAQGVPAEKAAAGLGAQVALARRESPSRGSRHLGLARALVEEMPHTLRALSGGLITEWTATVVARATACLTVEDRRRVDEALSDKLAGMTDRRAEAAANALAYQLDPHAFVTRGRKAVKDRKVTVRPAPDVMSYLTAHLPVAEGIACWAALDQAAKSLKAAGDDRSVDQIRADTLVHRLTGIDPVVRGFDVELNLVMTDTSLFGTASTAARLAGYGPVPAPLARDLARTGSTRPDLQPDQGQDTTGPHPLAGEPGLAGVGDRVKVWVRRLFTDPVEDTLTHRDPRRRAFTGSLRETLIARDITCRTPWCDAPVRHADHILPHAQDGQTSLDNGQGLCEACNYTKHTPGWTHHPITQPHGTTTIRITTPPRHTHHTTPPPILDSLHPLAPEPPPPPGGPERPTPGAVDGPDPP